ncbi:MAG: DUF262 domain-containing protein [Clostridiales bacterium]|nr:DUF262 domain-containing protein [Clostridiales bacterium]
MAYTIGDGRSIKSLLGGTVKYIIPRYQRRYIWNDKHWQDLLDDLIFVYENKQNNSSLQHFFSTFIFETTSSDSTIDSYYIIDGQQRLSTVMVILSVICRLCIERENSTQHTLFSQYVSASDATGKYIKIVNDNADLLGEIIQSNYEYTTIDNLEKIDIQKYHSYSNEEKNIYKCYEFFYENIKSLIKDNSKQNEINNLIQFANCLLEMQVVQIIVDKEQEGYDIFEILNARGTPLAQHELLKNYIYKFYKPVGDIDNAKQMWCAMEKHLTIKNNCYLPNFIVHYAIHKYEKPDKTNTLLRIIKKANQKNNTKSILSDLYEKSMYYKYIVNPHDILESDLFDQKDIRENIYSILLYFSLKNQSQYRPLLLSLFSQVKQYKEKYYDSEMQYSSGKVEKEELTRYKNLYRECQKDVNEAFTYLLHFLLVETVIKKEQPKTFEQTVHELAASIENNTKTVKSIRDELKISITKDMFVSSFCLLGYSNKVDIYKRSKTKYDVRQLLRMYELHLQGTDELTIDNMTIEHISNDSKENINTCYIGNLLPLAESIQKDIGLETSLKGKLPFYKKSKFATVKQFVDKYGAHSTWNNKKIDERSRYIAEIFYNEIFNLN